MQEDLSRVFVRTTAVSLSIVCIGHDGHLASPVKGQVKARVNELDPCGSLFYDSPVSVTILHVPVCTMGGASNKDSTPPGEHMDFLLGKYWVKFLHLKNMFLLTLVLMRIISLPIFTLPWITQIY